MDTRNKRASAIGVGLAFVSLFPNPDGAIAQPDRQQTAYCYAGIIASELTTAQIVAMEFTHQEPTMEITHEEPSMEISHDS